MTQDKAGSSRVDMATILPILNRISILGGLTDAQLRVVLSRMRTVSFARGETVFRQGESPDSIYTILSGRIRIVVDLDTEPKELIEYGVGQCFGETSVIGILPHTASAVAAEDVELLVLSREALHALYHEECSLFGMLILNIAREACRRLARTDKVLLHYAAAKH